MKLICCPDRIFKEHQPYMDEFNNWGEEQYDQYFSQYFKLQRSLKDKINKGGKDLSDADLKSVLTELPIDMIEAASALSEFKTNQEVIKIRVKDAKTQRTKELSTSSYTKAEIKDMVDSEVSGEMLLITVYSNIIERVEREMSYSRELIMGCKKIWDARRRSEEPLLGAVDSSQLPEYQFDSKPN